MITTLRGVQRAAREIERGLDYLHASPTTGCVRDASAAAAFALQQGLPVEGLYPAARFSNIPPTHLGFVQGDLPADVTVTLGRFWDAKRRAIVITFSHDAPPTLCAYEAGFVEGPVWTARLQGTWTEIAAWLNFTPPFEVQG